MDDNSYYEEISIWFSILPAPTDRDYAKLSCSMKLCIDQNFLLDSDSIKLETEANRDPNLPVRIRTQCVPNIDLVLIHIDFKCEY